MCMIISLHCNTSFFIGAACLGIQDFYIEIDY